MLLFCADRNVMDVLVYLLISFWYGVSAKTTGKTITIIIIIITFIYVSKWFNIAANWGHLGFFLEQISLRPSSFLWSNCRLPLLCYVGYISGSYFFSTLRFVFWQYRSMSLQNNVVYHLKNQRYRFNARGPLVISSWNSVSFIAA